MLGEWGLIHLELLLGKLGVAVASKVVIEIGAFYHFALPIVRLPCKFPETFLSPSPVKMEEVLPRISPFVEDMGSLSPCGRLASHSVLILRSWALYV